MPELPTHPNLVLIITDQERAPMHWPEGFARKRLVSRSRLLRHGVNFENAVCNTAMCSPSRATFLTRVMPAQHRVIDTLTDPDVSTERDRLAAKLASVEERLACPTGALSAEPG